MNDVNLVGRLVTDPELEELTNGKRVLTVTLSINRNYKNEDGIYETDFIRCILWNGIAATTAEHCRRGDVVGIKGRLQTRKYEDDNKNIHYATEVVAERVTFLSSKSKNKDKEDIDER